MTVDRAALVGQFARDLDALAARHAGHPRDELRALLLLGLEREAIVTVAYRREIVEERLGRMPLDARTRAVVARAVRWTWRDEETHARALRGLLLADADLPDRLRTGLVELEGRLAGWASSRQQHHRWSDAPFVRAVAEVLELAGIAAGRVPDHARGELRFSSFSDFAAFSAAAEDTARMGFERMAALATGEVRETFLHMGGDEGRHARLFDVLALAFDDADRLGPDWDAPRLEAAFADIGQRFLARPREGSPAWDNPLGKGGTVLVREDEVLDRALDAALAPLLARVRPGASVALKTTFMHAADRLDPSPHVAPALLHAIDARLRAAGADPTWLEGRNVYDRFHAGRDVAAVARYLGLDLRLVDATADQVRHDYVRGLGQDSVARTWRDADLRVLVGKLRSNPVSGAMLSLDAVDGLGARQDAFVFGERRADRHTATMMLLDAFPPDFALLDAWSDVPDGLLGAIACADPLEPRRLYASTDAVALDAVAARNVGLDPAAALAGAAFDWFGDPRPDLAVDGPDTPIRGWRAHDATEWTALLSRLAEPVYAHASGHGAVFVPPMDTSAFPPHAPPSAALRLARDLVRSLTGLEGPPEGLPCRHALHDGARVRVCDTGGDGLPIVLLHGYPENLHLWARVVRRLAHRRCMALDWPGLGDSEPGRAGADPEALAAWLRGFLDARGFDRVLLAGADMGAQPASVLTALHPDRVAGLVLLNHLAFADGAQSAEIRVMRSTGLASAAFRAAPGVVFSRCLATFLPDESLPRTLEAELWRCFRARPVRDRLAAMCHAYERALGHLPELYAAIRRPVRIVWGAADPHFPRAQAERLAATVPGASLALLPGAGHWPQWTHAGEIADALEAPWTS